MVIFFYLFFFLYGSVWWSLDHLTQKPAWLCFAALFLWPFSISPILRVLSFKVFPKCQFHFLVLQIITIPLLIRAVRLRHPSSPLLGWAASSQVQTSQCDLCFLTSGNIVTFFSPWFPLWVLFTSPKKLNYGFVLSSPSLLKYRVCRLYIISFLILFLLLYCIFLSHLTNFPISASPVLLFWACQTRSALRLPTLTLLSSTLSPPL